MTFERFVSMVAITALLTLAGGCSSIPFFGGDDEGDIPTANTSEQMLYRNAQRYLRSGNYEQAIGQLEALEAQYPFGPVSYTHLTLPTIA